MDPFLARTMVESLSKGIDPLSGRALPPKDSCSNEEIQEALLEVLTHCSIESNEQYLVRLKEEKAATRRAKRNEYAKRYPRVGEPWQDEEEKQLLRMHRKGFNIYKIANVLERTPDAIADRLKKLQEDPIYRTAKNRNIY